MFEKEAEEYFETECLHSYADTEEQLKEDVVPAFQKGAEFGYNKAKEEDKWHYVKDGDLPKDDTKVIALMADKEICIAHFYRRNVWDKIGTIIAWKEIVLPKEIKENEL